MFPAFKVITVSSVRSATAIFTVNLDSFSNRKLRRTFRSSNKLLIAYASVICAYSER